jgi:hypothetical protein
MKLQEEMFALVADWESGSQTGKSFLADKPVSLSKFDYRRAKYNKSKSCSGIATQNHSGDFRELLLSDATREDASKVLKVTTPSGLHITICG